MNLSWSKIIGLSTVSYISAHCIVSLDLGAWFLRVSVACVHVCVWFTGGWSSGLYPALFSGHVFTSITSYLICQKESLKTCFWKLLQFLFRHKPGLARWREGLVWTEANKHVFAFYHPPPSPHPHCDLVPSETVFQQNVSWFELWSCVSVFEWCISWKGRLVIRMGGNSLQPSLHTACKGLWVAWMTFGSNQFKYCSCDNPPSHLDFQFCQSSPSN